MVKLLKDKIETPTFRLFMTLAVMMISLAVLLLLALRYPVTGYAFQPEMTVTAAEQTFVLEPLDFTPEPGEISDDAELKRFYERQQVLSGILSTPQITVTDTANGAEPVVVATRDRHISDLPSIFWIQVVVGIGALLISGWIWALKPADLAARLFALSGVSTLTFTFAAALYTTRELALPVMLFRTFSGLNTAGASLFGICMIGLFLVYPVRLARWRQLMWVQAAFFTAWTAAAIAGLLPASFGGNLATLVEMIFIVVAIVAQFFATRGIPQARAALLWLGLAVMGGAGAFIALNALPLVLDMNVAIEQGYAFLFFLVIYAGLAAGLRRYRLFDVGAWAYRFLFYAIGAALFVLIDVLLVSLLGLNRVPALSLSLLALAFLYLPLRDYIWRRFGRRKQMKTQDLLTEAMNVALSVTPEQRQTRWKNLLQKLFDPLEVFNAESAVNTVTVENEGVKLHLPAVANSPALTLAYPWSGRALFNTESVQLAEQVVQLVNQAESGRQAYERGVHEERQRMARDLHDDVGARLLTGITLADEKLKPNLQAALEDIRSIVSGISDESVILSRLLPEIRHETARRLEGAGITLDWPLQSLPESEMSLTYRQYKSLRSAVREVVSNVIRHSGAKNFSVHVELQSDGIKITLTDNGCGFSEEALNGNSSAKGGGNGLKNLRYRLNEISGTLQIQSTGSGVTAGTCIVLLVPAQVASIKSQTAN